MKSKLLTLLLIVLLQSCEKTNLRIIDGVVLEDYTQLPVANLKVELMLADGAYSRPVGSLPYNTVYFNTVSDANGRFHFNLENMDAKRVYQLEASNENYSSYASGNKYMGDASRITDTIIVGKNRTVTYTFHDQQTTSINDTSLIIIHWFSGSMINSDSIGFPSIISYNTTYNIHEPLSCFATSTEIKWRVINNAVLMDKDTTISLSPCVDYNIDIYY